MARFVENQKGINVVRSSFEKRLIAIGMQMEREVKQSMISGEVSVPGEPPGVDSGRLRASISTNWTNSGKQRGASSFISGTDITYDPIVFNKNPKMKSENDKVGEPDFDGNFHVIVGTNVEYGPYLEFGTRRMAARPFLRPVFDRLKNKVVGLIKKK